MSVDFRLRPRISLNETKSGRKSNLGPVDNPFTRSVACGLDGKDRIGMLIVRPMRKTRSDQTQRYRGAILALLLACVALVVHEIYGEHGYLAVRRERREYDLLQQEIHRLQEENQQLERRIEALKADPKAIERLARDQMHMARPGERIYTLPEKDKDPKSPDSVASENSNAKQ